MAVDFTQNSCREFVEVLASNAPVPGGGGAAALVVAVILAYRGKSLLTVSLAASATVMLTEWILTFFA